MKSKILILLVFLSLINHQVLSQSRLRDGFIILHNGDTIHGKISHTRVADVYRYCNFHEGNVSKHYTPEQIAGYGFSHNNSFFSSQVKPGSFVEVLISGKLSLYKYERHYYVQKEGDSLIALENRKVKGHIAGRVYDKEDHTWRSLLTAMASDCPQISEILNTAWFNERNITEFVLRYYEFTGAEFIEYKAHLPWTKLGVEMKAGLSYFKISKIGGKDPNLENKISAYSPMAGITLITTFPRTSESFSIHVDALYRKRVYTSSSMVVRDERTVFNDIHYQLSSLTVPLSVRYNAYSLKLPFYFYTGLNYTYFFESEYVIRAEVVNNNVVRTYQNKDNLNNRLMPGIHLGFGIPWSYKGINGSLGSNIMGIYHSGSGFNSASIYLNLQVL